MKKQHTVCIQHNIEKQTNYTYIHKEDTEVPVHRYKMKEQKMYLFTIVFIYFFKEVLLYSKICPSLRSSSFPSQNH